MILNGISCHSQHISKLGVALGVVQRLPHTLRIMRPFDTAALHYLTVAFLAHSGLVYVALLVELALAVLQVYDLRLTLAA